MVRHTKRQVLGGEEVLQLPPKTEELVEVVLTAEEQEQYNKVGVGRRRGRAWLHTLSAALPQSDSRTKGCPAAVSVKFPPCPCSLLIDHAPPAAPPCRRTRRPRPCLRSTAPWATPRSTSTCFRSWRCCCRCAACAAVRAWGAGLAWACWIASCWNQAVNVGISCQCKQLLPTAAHCCCYYFPGHCRRRTQAPRPHCQRSHVWRGGQPAPPPPGG